MERNKMSTWDNIKLSFDKKKIYFFVRSVNEEGLAKFKEVLENS